MAAITVNRITTAGLTEPTLSAATAGGDTIVPGDATFLIVNNGGGSSVTVTVDSQVNCDQGSDHDLSVAVAAGAQKWIKIGPQRRFRNTSGVADISYSGVTSVTVGGAKVDP